MLLYSIGTEPKEFMRPGLCRVGPLSFLGCWVDGIGANELSTDGNDNS